MRSSFASRDLLGPALFTTVTALVFAAAVWALVPARVMHLNRHAIFVIGAFGLWRYGWFMVNAGRGIWYNHITYPRLRRLCAALPEQLPERLYIVVLSYKEQSATSRNCFRSIVAAMANTPCDTVVLASVASQEEAELIRKAVNLHSSPEQPSIDLRFTLQKNGKRIAIGHALRFLRDYRETLGPTNLEHETVLLMDGDSELGETIFEVCLPQFRLDPGLGAITTNEAPRHTPRWIITQWFALKFAKRHFYMSSHSLSRRVMTLTGRGSFVRAGIAFSDEFISYLESDHIDHPVHGRIEFLLGDDKSTLFCVLKNRWRMLYIPDAWVYAMEDRDMPFFRLTTQLMARWYGNMLRNNIRCLQLGPRCMPPFMWLCFLDQRLSMWTGMVGPLGAVLLSIFVNPYLLLIYIGWVTFVRLIQLWVVSGGTLKMHPIMIPLQLYDQAVGSVIKIYSLFHLGQQTWSKGNEAETRNGNSTALAIVQSRVTLAASATVFVVLLLVVLKVVPAPF
jgi:glycosyltransferase Alg8